MRHSAILEVKFQRSRKNSVTNIPNTSQRIPGTREVVGSKAVFERCLKTNEASGKHFYGNSEDKYWLGFNVYKPYKANFT